MLSGVFAQFVPLPLVWSYIILLVLAVAAVVALALAPDDRPAHSRRWRPQALRLLPELRLTFSIAALSVALAYSVGAIFLSLGAHMIDQFAHTPGTAVAGVLLGHDQALWLRGSHPTPLVAQSQHHPAMAWEGVGQS